MPLRHTSELRKPYNVHFVPDTEIQVGQTLACDVPVDFWGETPARHWVYDPFMGWYWEQSY